MNFKSTDEFYQQLASDYRDKAGADKEDKSFKKHYGIDDYDNADKRVSQSFLYRYFKGKKDFEAKKISRDKNQFFKYSKSEKDKYILLRAAYLAHKKEIISDEEYKEIFLKVNACSKSGQKKREKLFETNPGEARRQLEGRLLRDCAERFIDNVNKRIKKSSRKSEENSYTCLLYTSPSPRD